MAMGETKGEDAEPGVFHGPRIEGGLQGSSRKLVVEKTWEAAPGGKVACEVSVTKKVYSNMSTQTEDTPSPPRYGAMDEDAAMLRPPFPNFGLWQGYESSVGGINNVGDPWRIGTEDRTQPWSFGLSWEGKNQPFSLDMSREARGAMDTPELSAETVALTMAQQVFSDIDCFVDLRDNIDPVKVRIGTDASVGAVGGQGENLYPATVCYKLGWEKVLDKTATPETATPPDETKKATSGFRGEMSKGAFWHDAGVCRPCNFMSKGDGCRAGADCRFCHLCTEANRRRRKRERRRFLRGVAGEPVEVETVPDVNIEENPDSVIAFGKVLELPAGNCVTTPELPSFPWSSSKEDPSVPWKIKVTRGADKETRFRTELARV